MFGPFPIAHLLGITRDHEAVFRQVETELTKQGYICFAPVIYDFDIYLQHKQLLKDMCYEKLLQADLCVVVPHATGRLSEHCHPFYLYRMGQYANGTKRARL